jgi:hypothetical protein
MRIFPRAMIAGLLALALAPSIALDAAKVRLPAGYADGHAIGYGDVDGDYTAVTPGNPLPVSSTSAALADPGSDATKAQAVQGCTGCKAVAASIADGSDSATGAKADAAYAGSGAASQISILKGIYNGMAAPTPAGSNLIGQVQIQPDVTVGPVTGVSAINTDLLTNTVLGWYDAANYHSGSITLYPNASASACRVSFEQTNDTTNAAAGQPLYVFDGSAINGQPLTTTATLTASTLYQYEFPVVARYVRARVSTACSAGSMGATAVLSQLPYAALRLNMQQTTAANLNMAAIGPTAEDASVSSVNPMVMGGMVRTATAPTTLVANDAAKLTISNGAALIQKPFSVPQTDWQYTGALTTTTAAQAKAAGAASIKNYVTAFQYQNTSATATTVIILDGAATIHTLYAPANMAMPAVMDFPTPLQGTAATALNVNCGATGANVLVNVQGYQAP